MENLLYLFGKNLKNIRKSKGLTQEALAEKCGINFKYYSAIERGKVNVSFNTITKIAKGLGINIKEMFNFQTNKERFSLEKEIKISNILNILNKINEKEIDLILKVLKLIFINRNK